MLRAAREMRRRLGSVPGLRAHSLFITVELEPVLGGRLTPTRWAFFCGWEEREARDEFFADPSPLRPFVDGGRESWGVALDPVRVLRGEWRGWRPSTAGIEPLARDEPVASITYAHLYPRYVPAFLRNNRTAVKQIRAAPGLLDMIGISDRWNTPATFSVWRSQGDVVRYAYGPGAHKPIQRRALDTPWGDDYFFARFRPVASHGTWNGRDPLAAVAREPAAAA